MAKIMREEDTKNFKVEVSERFFDYIERQKKEMKELGIQIQYEFEKQLWREANNVERIILNRKHGNILKDTGLSLRQVKFLLNNGKTAEEIKKMSKDEVKNFIDQKKNK